MYCVVAGDRILRHGYLQIKRDIPLPHFFAGVGVFRGTKMQWWKAVYALGVTRQVALFQEDIRCLSICCFIAPSKVESLMKHAEVNDCKHTEKKSYIFLHSAEGQIIIRLLVVVFEKNINCSGYWVQCSIRPAGLFGWSIWCWMWSQYELLLAIVVIS